MLKVTSVRKLNITAVMYIHFSPVNSFLFKVWMSVQNSHWQYPSTADTSNNITADTNATPTLVCYVYAYRQVIN